MGCFDWIRAKCCFCHAEVMMQTKALGNNCMEIIKVGNETPNKDLSNSLFMLKDRCECKNRIVLRIENGIITGTTKDDPTYVESIFGEYMKVEE